MKQKKTLFVLFAVAVGIGILLLGGLLLTQRFSKTTNSLTNTEPSKVDASDFTFTYNQDIFEKETYVCQIPVSQETRVTDSDAIRLTHSFAFPWTDDVRGDEHTDLTDMSVSLCAVEGNYKELAAYYSGVPTDTTVHGRPAQKIEMGAEGSGANEYYIQMNDDTTLVVRHNYIAPFFNPALSEDSQYISMDRQEKLFEDILTSLTFK